MTADTVPTQDGISTGSEWLKGHAQPPADIRPVLEALADARVVIPAE